MKIIIIQERGRNEANRAFREALCLQRGIERAGHEAVVWGLNYDNFSIPFNEISSDCDALLSLENYDTGWHPDISSFKGRKVFWSIDSHCALPNHQSHCRKHRFDLLLNASEQYIDSFNGLVDQARWFPNAYPSDLFTTENGISREHDIGFCGSMIGNRGAWLNMISSKFKVKLDVMKLGSEMVRALRSYRISFNINIADDINFRTFESTGAGSLLLTNYTPNLEKLFKINEEVVIYRNSDELMELIEYFINNEDHRAKIAAMGQQRSEHSHTYDVRSKQFIEILSS